MKKPVILVALFALLLAHAATAEILPLKDVRKGMKGYGLTVFEGTSAERFDVEIMGVLTNIGPKQDLILAKVDSEMIRKSGVVAGMSGSPIYIDGKVIGALAYAWPFSREGVAGITPIEEMLRIDRRPGIAVKPAVAPKLPASEFLKILGERAIGESAEKFLQSLAPARTSVGGALPIAVPVSFSNFSSSTLERFGSLLDGMGMMSVPSGSSGTSASDLKASFEPGDPIAGVLIEGDMSVAASGTVTYVDGDRVYAFGHPFLDIGPVSFPMAKSEVVGVLPSLARSFKFSNTGPVVGSLVEDRSAGIMGRLGARSDLIPVKMELVTADGARQSYNFRVVRHPQLSPLMLAIAADTVVSNAQRSAGERTVRIDSEITIAGFPTVRLQEGWAGSQARQAIPAYLAMVSGYLMSNEFHDASIEGIKVTVRHDDELKIAKLMEAAVETSKDGQIHPGDTVRVRALLKPYRGEEFTESFDVKIPDNQQPGVVYIMVASGTMINRLDFAMVPPDPRTLSQLVDVLRRLRPSTDLSVGFYAPSDGAVAAGVLLPELPPSMAMLVSGDSSNSLQAPVRYRAGQSLQRPLGYVVDGAIKLDLLVKPAR